MNRKFLLGSAIAAALLFGANVASACSLTAWNAVQGLVAADAAEPSPGNNNPTLGGNSRYSGRCGLEVNAQNKFVTDNTPAGEVSYLTRFYVYTGDITGSTPILRAENTGATPIITATYNGGATNTLVIGINGTANTDSIVLQDNRWYSVELNWAQATGVTGRVRGAGAGPCATPACPNNEEISVVGTSPLTVDTVRMGMIAASGITVTMAMFFDEFDSRRTTSPGRLRRGDANASNTITTADITGVLLDISGDLRVGQPDANESGVVNTADVTAVLNLIGVPD